MAKIYDPLGLVLPITLGGKFLYRDICDAKLAWDAKLPSNLIQSWVRWEEKLSSHVTVPQSLAAHQEDIQAIELHAFSDASGKGVAAAVYTVVVQEKGVNQVLVSSRARLAKKGLTIPRLELVSGHMAVNVLSNVSEALEGFPVSVKYCWLDSTVALHWIRRPGEYKYFVSNRVQKIQAYSVVVWYHVRTSDNPADIGSRSGEVTDHALWWNGPEWLSCWPPDIVTSATQESLAEAKSKRDSSSVAVAAAADELDDLLEKSSRWRTIRVTAWILRFIQNSRAKKTKRLRGPLTADETKKAELFWGKRVQVRTTADGRYEDDLLQLNLQPNCDGVLECRGRVQGHYPICLPDGQRYTEKLVAQAHLATLHGGVGSAMAKVREYYWVPRLRRLTKKIVKSCHGCRRFRVQPIPLHHQEIFQGIGQRAKHPSK